MNKSTLLLCWLMLCTWLVNAQNIDLELSISSTNPNPAIYTKVPLTFTLTNKGNATATNIRVRTGACSDEGGFRFFGYGNDLATTSNPIPVASTGAYDIPFQNWDIPQLASGSTATLTISAFVLSEDPQTLLGEVVRANENDTDSSAGNFGGCVPTEDDEASFVINDDGNGGGSGNNAPCQLQISNAQYPTSAAPGETITISAQITNTGNSTSSPSTIDFYQLLGDRVPSLTNKRTGENIPSLGAGQSTTLSFNVTLPAPLYINSPFPLEAPRLGDLILVTDDATSTLAYLDCNEVLNITPNYPDADLQLSWIGDATCYEGSDRVVERDLQFKNSSNQTLNYPIYIALSNLRFLNNNINGTIELAQGTAYWVIRETVAPGQVLTLNRPFRIPESETGAQTFSPTIRPIASNVDDANSSNNSVTATLTKCSESACDFNNLPWLDARLANNQLCNQCFKSVIAVDIEGTTYIVFTADSDNCQRAPAVIYDCAGNFICQFDGISPVSGECLNLFNAPSTTLATLWEKATDCNNQNPVSIAARAWFDGNNNGIRELTGGGGDLGLSGVTVRLENANGQVVATGTTNTQGVVVFSNQPAGTYRVAFDIPAGQEATIKFAPGAASGRDSEINPDGKTDFFTLAPGESVSEVGGGFRTKTGGGDKIDLELTGSTPNAAIGIYKKAPITFTLQNNSSVTATNVVVDLGACKDGQGFGSPTIFFDNNSGLVYSSPAPTTTIGSFSLVTRKWVIPSLNANSTATLTLNLFTLTADERAVIAEVRVANQDDVDSTPANMNGCTPTEDDEASVVLNGDTTGGTKPDFALSNVVYITPSSNGANTVITDNSSIDINDRIINVQQNTTGQNSTGVAYNTVTKFVLSSDEIVGNVDDILLGQFNRTFRTPTSGLFDEVGYGELSIPVNTPVGTYNLIMKLDANNEVAETNENNNVSIIRNLSITNGVCTCAAIFEPVCGANGVTYNNSCEAECAGIFDYTPGSCECICPTVIAPVCGSDGVTYNNSCEAECAGIFDYIDGECPTGTDGVDLELEIVLPASYAIYTKVLFQARLKNNGTTNAEDVTVSFPIPAEFVHSSNAATVGEYDLFDEVWEVGTLKAGETAVLDLTLFALSNDETIAYAQVLTCKQNDIDSTPGNGSCCVADEDDEAVATITSNLKNGNNGNAYRLADIHRNIEITTIRPTVATNEIEVFVQSKMAELDLEIYDLQGNPVVKQPYQNTTGLNRLRVDISDLPTGIYLLRFAGTAGRQTVRFVKMQM